MKLQDYFISVEGYINAVDKYIRRYFSANNYSMLTDAARQLCYAEFENKDVRKKYVELESKYIKDYKLFTDFVVQVNMLSWASDMLLKNGFDDRCEWVDLYSDLYYQAKDLFYDTWGNDDIACDYFFDMTD